ncbi:chondroitin sulfate N-acetylgalactosaminyltransferase 1 [Myxocyprinus asiaticus]|uniref:chondroitin sulfate N-acetylgalactosaminyltransferase 1 n=1 Tax=Myxocyprinus asiaticus TaxID=70543 RepID=UPI0022223317|nr:chondroitin sulfate N-acetylgalactosaminyltransferase 1 [Myxocyprinus asiaticus]
MLKRWFLVLTHSRRVILVLMFCCVLLLYCLACRTHNQRPQHQTWPGHTVAGKTYKVLLQHHEEQYLQYTNNLTKRISQLKKELQERSRQLQRSVEQAAIIFPLDHGDKSPSELEEFLQKQLQRSEVHTGERVPNEFAVLPFESFTLHRVYQLEMGLTQHPVERPFRPDRRNELNGALEAALHVLNEPQVGDTQRRRIYSPKDFLEGIFRTEKDKGTIYDLAFRENSVPDFRRLVFFRPFAPLMKVKDELVDTSKILINIIVPLTKRVDTFRQFMQNFSEAGIRQDGRTHLTVVFFGSEKLDEVKGILDLISRRLNYKNITLIHLHEEFSRARGLEVGVRGWKHSNVLLFFCDVNVRFTAEFLKSCRMNAEPGKKVFYPVMFSQYNPEVLYGHSIPRVEEQLVIRKDFGFWKDYDFRMTCLYRSDFINIGGFDLTKDRATDDVHLYRKFLHSGLLVVRAPSRGLFHMWHEILCPEHLSAETFKLCLQSKAMNEAPHSHLSKLLFQQHINNQMHKYNKHNVKP